MRIIKRYANRRLYDSETSKTITLDDIANLIKSDIPFKVIDSSTNEDITTKILAQTFIKINLNGLDETLNHYLLSTFIREGSENMQQFVEKLVLSGIGLANQTKGYIEGIVSSLISDLQGGEDQKRIPLLTEAESNKNQKPNINQMMQIEQIENEANNDKNVVAEIVDYVNNKANMLAEQMQSGIKSLGLSLDIGSWHSSQQKIAELEKEIETLKKMLAEKNEQINKLNQR